LLVLLLQPDALEVAEEVHLVRPLDRNLLCQALPSGVR
jgi:hypothetical protein